MTGLRTKYKRLLLIKESDIEKILAIFRQASEAKAPKTKPTKAELTEDAMNMMGWDESENLGELYTPTRKELIGLLVNFAKTYV